jgi:glucosamine--fructose-6-phosphate aminotransferase (isomerizing)
MCGITACVGHEDISDTLLSGLENLEYRGYDSSGIATNNGHGITVVKREGKIENLETALASTNPNGRVGIGHTRWSTHGPPTDRNAHPHTDCDGRLAVAHNGIIENHAELREALTARGHVFTSDTDTEVVPHLLEEYLDEGYTPVEALQKTVDQLEGSYALVVVDEDHDALYATRNGSPLVLGIDGDRRFLASDVPSFLDFTSEVVYLEDGDIVQAHAGGHTVVDSDGETVSRDATSVDWSPEDAERNGYPHFMLKEINEQPDALDRALKGRITEDWTVDLESFPPGTFDDVDEVHFIACGTSYHAALYARQLLVERNVPTHVFSAGEYVTSPAPISDETLVIAVTQSGETADTLGSMRHAMREGARTVAVTNVVGSTAARMADDALFIRAGPEIGVAATKTFSSQVAVLALLSDRLSTDVTGSPAEDRESFLRALKRLPNQVQQVLDESTVSTIANRYQGSDGHFFIGRGVAYPVALEGALKFKEITYEHAEGFAASELKHGPLALVTPNTPVFAVFSGRHDEKTLSNAEEVRTRGAPVIGIASEKSTHVRDVVDEFLPIPDTHPELTGILANVQLQLVSYHVADLLDRSIDQPRNLAKSVTVE